MLFCTPIYGGTIDPNTPDKKYIEYGSKFESVVKICGKYRDDMSFCASAVIINDHWILTAAHVVANSRSAKIIDDNNNEYILTKIILHDGFSEDKFGWHDIALGYSEKLIKIDQFPKLYSEPNEVGKICSIVGYGFTGTFLTGSKFHDNKKRGGSNFIDEIDRDLLICSPSKYSDKKRTELEFLIASGDSGGGLFIDQKLAGINSCVIATDRQTNSSYSDISGHTRISQHIDWINSNINEKNINHKKIEYKSLIIDNNLFMTSMLLSINFLFFLMGFAWCKLSSHNNHYDTNFFSKNLQKSKNIEYYTNQFSSTIDDSKVVVDIKTDGLVKKYDSLGEIKNTEDSIAGSINKLKNMKG